MTHCNTAQLISLLTSEVLITNDEAILLLQLLSPTSTLSRAVVRDITRDVLDSYLEKALANWAANALRMLPTKWSRDVDTRIEVILIARKHFPSTIGQRVTSSTIAHVRHRAHIRAATVAVQNVALQLKPEKNLWVETIALALEAETGITTQTVGPFPKGLAEEVAIAQMRILTNLAVQERLKMIRDLLS